jgi:polysaccharide deacetylase family protein (PEP-CTERM system associated)
MGAFPQGFEVSPVTPPRGRPLLTVDVEDWFDANYRSLRPPVDPPSTVERNTDRILELLAARGHRATFFVLGRVAERFPRLVERIAREGHEVGCHGFEHELVRGQGPERFAESLRRGRDAIAAACGRPPTGFRAPSASIVRETLWAFDRIAEAGYRYDSSLAPISSYLFGIRGTPGSPFFLRTPAGARLLEVPLPSLTLLGMRLPRGGGFSMRLLPGLLETWFLRREQRRGGFAMIYLHPRELDPEAPRYRLDLSPLESFVQHAGLRRHRRKLLALLDRFSWTSIEEGFAAALGAEAAPAA